MTVWRSVPGGVAAAAALLLSGCTSTGSDNKATDGGAPALRLVAFDSCADTLAELRKAAAASPPTYGGHPGRMPRNEEWLSGADRAAGAPMAPGASKQDHSSTNNHEAGVDEADLVKTDGRRIVTVVDGSLRVVDVATRKLVGKVDLDDGRGFTGAPSALLLHGDRALVVAQNSYPIGAEPMIDGPMPPMRTPMPHHGIRGSRLVLVELDGTPRITSRLTVDGGYVDARQIGEVARVVVRSAPRLRYPTVHPDKPTSWDTFAQDYRAAVQKSTLDDWLPRHELERDGRKEKGRVGCGHVVRPDKFSGTSMLTLYTFDLGNALTSGDPLTVMADGETVYASTNNLYVAHNGYARWGIPGPIQDGPRRVQARTEVYQFDIKGEGQPKYVASGTVPGNLLNQYSLSEHDGHLRAATTSDLGGDVPCCDRAPRTESTVYVLERQDGKLVEVGRVGGLGRGERIHSVRFVGQVGYVVTFRQTDPLYTIDLREPRRPRVVGELKITGYSAYLHPVDERTVIGVGQEATKQGARLGTQISVFDVSQPAEPRLVAKHHVKFGSSEVEFDPHAFLYWPKTRMLVVPVTGDAGVPELPGGPGAEPVTPTSGALVLTLRDGQLEQRAVVQHPRAEWRYGGPGIRRSLVAGGSLWTVSGAGVRADDLDALTQQAWLPFR
jgi:hypothetical protein